MMPSSKQACKQQNAKLQPLGVPLKKLCHRQASRLKRLLMVCSILLMRKEEPEMLLASF